jgi:hypothetical protein
MRNTIDVGFGRVCSAHRHSEICRVHQFYLFKNSLEVAGVTFFKRPAFGARSTLYEVRL